MTEKLLQDSRRYHDLGYEPASIIVKKMALALREAGLLPDQIDTDGPRKRGPKRGAVRVDIDPNKLRRLRLDQNLSQKNLASRANLSDGFVSAFERGRHPTMSGESAKKLSLALGIEVSDLLKSNEGGSNVSGA